MDADCITHDIRVIEADDSITSARVSIEYNDWFTGDGNTSICKPLILKYQFSLPYAVGFR